MKNLLLATALIIGTTTAHASFYQDYCSNAEGSTKTSEGHVSNNISVTERSYNQATGQIINNVVELGDQKAKVTVEENMTISELDESEGCDTTNPSSGFYSVTTTSIERVTITKLDGSKFSKNTLGVSDNLMAVETTLICEKQISSEAYCESK